MRSPNRETRVEEFTVKSLPVLVALTLCASLSGCAAGYHAYPCGCVDYGYCPPPPLAYTGYSGCPSPLAASYSPSPPMPEVLDQPTGDSAGSLESPR